MSRFADLKEIEEAESESASSLKATPEIEVDDEADANNSAEASFQKKRRSKYDGTPTVPQHVAIIDLIDKRMCELRDLGVVLIDEFWSKREALTPGLALKQRGNLGARLKEYSASGYTYYDFSWFHFKFYKGSDKPYQPNDITRGKSFSVSARKAINWKTKPWEIQLFHEIEPRLAKLREEIYFLRATRVEVLRAVRAAQPIVLSGK